MAKTIALSDEQYERVVKSARACGVVVGKGRKSGLGRFITLSSEQSAQNCMKADVAYVVPECPICRKFHQGKHGGLA
jgi:hypothetical protein